MQQKAYHKYKYNTLAQKRLYADCLESVLLSKASLNNKLKDILTAEDKK